MSEMTCVDVEFKDEELIIDTLKLMGYKPQVYEDGKEIDTYYNKETNPKAHIVVGKSQFGGYAAMGFERYKDGFKMHIDNMDQNKFGVKKMKCNYSEAKAMKVINRTAKYSFRNKIEDNKKIRIRARINY